MAKGNISSQAVAHPFRYTYSPREAAQAAGVSLPTLYQWTERTDFQGLLRVGRKKLILIEAFENWLRTQATSGR